MFSWLVLLKVEVVILQQARLLLHLHRYASDAPAQTIKMAADPVKNPSMEESTIPRKDMDLESSNGETAVIAETARVLDHAAEVKLTRKFDLRILPILAVMCKFRAKHTTWQNLVC